MDRLIRVIGVAAVVAGFAVWSLACKDDEPTTPAGGGISSTAFPGNAASLTAGAGATTGTLTGGTPPYMINTQPDGAVATAELSGTNNATLAITPIGVGATSVIIEDSSPVARESLTGQMVTINITVTDGGVTGLAGSGMLSVFSSVGNFSASGAFTPNAGSGQGVGGLRVNENGSDMLTVYAYSARSITDVDIVAVGFVYDGGTLMTGDYSFTPTGGMYGMYSMGFSIDPLNPSGAYLAISGTANLSSLTATSAEATFNGNGFYSPNPSQLFDFSKGMLTVTGFGSGNAFEKRIAEIARKMLREARERNSR